MPWHLSGSHPDCSGWAVVKDADNSVVGCHPTKEKAQAQLAALVINVKEDQMQTEERVTVDNSTWDGNSAMTAAQGEADYRDICAGHTDGDLTLRSSWKLPHHYPGKGPNADGVRAALQRFSQTQGLTDSTGAHSHLEAHMRDINPQMASAEPPDLTRETPRKNDLVRALLGGYELRDGAEGGMPRLIGHFTKYDEWTEIDSVREGRFMERSVRGAFAESFKKITPKVLFQHGRDPSIGDKVLGPAEVLREDEVGPYYEVPLLDTSYNRDLLPGLKEGLYGASFRFSVTEEDFEPRPGKSDYNPEGIPERTIRAAMVPEFGPVTFPAYAGASAAVRSMTDEFEFSDYTRDPRRLVEVIDYVRALSTKDLHPDQEGAEEKPPEEKPLPEKPPEAALSKEEQVDIEQYRSKEEKATRIAELKSELVRMAAEHTGILTGEPKERWDEADNELSELELALSEQEKRDARIAQFGDDEVRENGKGNAEPERLKSFQAPKTKTGDPYDRAAVYRDARSPEDQKVKFRENAMRVVESTRIPHEEANEADVKAHLERVLKADTRDSEIANRILLTGSPAYRKAFADYVTSGYVDRAVMAEGALATGGAFIVYDLDPTLIPTSNGAVNPYRRVCKLVQIAGTNEWRGVSSGAVVATYEAEATETVDRSPTLAQPAFIVKRAQGLIVYSIEMDQDVQGLQSELAPLIQDAKDLLEAVQFATGVGTTVFPQGQTVGFTNTATTGTTLVLAVNDIYKTEEALPPRFRPNAQWFANRFWYNKVRQLDTAGGANLWVQDLRTGLPANKTGNTGFNLIGYPANEASGMVATLATTVKEAVLCDPSYYVIVERIGMNVEFIQNLTGTTANYPSGQRGLYFYWRNTARVFDAAGGITLVGL